MSAGSAGKAPNETAGENTAHMPIAAPGALLQANNNRIFLWRRITDFLPLFLALFLALVTFWLVKSMPKIKFAAPSLPANEPDYYLRDFDLRRYGAQGKLQIELTGRYGEHFPGPDTIHMQQINTYSINEQGSTTRGRADRAISDRRGQNIELFDQVRVEHQPAAENGQEQPLVIFESNYLKMTDRQENISTNQPVKITRGSNVIYGTGMTYTDDNKDVQIQGRAQAVIQPRP